jgi:hypothetical protein
VKSEEGGTTMDPEDARMLARKFPRFLSFVIAHHSGYRLSLKDVRSILAYYPDNSFREEKAQIVANPELTEAFAEEIVSRLEALNYQTYHQESSLPMIVVIDEEGNFWHYGAERTLPKSTVRAKPTWREELNQEIESGGNNV